MIFINLDHRTPVTSRRTQFILATLGLLLTLVIYIAPHSNMGSAEKITVEEVESVHVLLDGIQKDEPDLRRLVEDFRLSFSQNPDLLPVGFFTSDMESQRTTLLRELVAKHQPPRENEIAIIGD